MGEDTAEGHPQLRVRREQVEELPEDGGDCKAGPLEGTELSEMREHGASAASMGAVSVGLGW